jgi:hypothetical protein
MFDEQVFPFSTLHPNAGPKLRAEIALHPTLFPAVNLGCHQTNGHMVNFSNITNQVCSSIQQHAADSVSANGVQVAVAASRSSSMQCQ